MNRKAQQEIVGFVLIVVLVMVGLMVFLIISVRNAPETTDSLEISNMIDSILRTTSECAVVYEPDYDSYEELFKSCYKNDGCSNLDRSACDFLNESFGEIVEVLIESEANLRGYEVEFFVKDGEGLLRWSGGNCSSFSSGAQRAIVSRGDSLIVRMRVCSLV
ncbi:hypothetical protein HNV12_03530 [Methanococcoides sp. SA1]|nr:hypothetical protein [Methanococcoides sp. SA1]